MKHVFRYGYLAVHKDVRLIIFKRGLTCRFMLFNTQGRIVLA